MESLWKLLDLMEPDSVAIIVTAVSVTFVSAFRAFNYWKEMERNRDKLNLAITLDKFHVLMIPVICSSSLVLMFYLFSSLSQLLTACIVYTSVSCLFLCFLPYVDHLRSKLGFADPRVLWVVTRCQMLLLVLSCGVVVAWLVSGNWILNNLLGISTCIVFVSYARLPNMKVCAMLLVGTFVYDIFWVFGSESFFGENVMATVATQRLSNPIHAVANRLNLPGLDLIAKELNLPALIFFPHKLFGGTGKGSCRSGHMLGVGDMAIPAMLLALVLSFDYRKSQDKVGLLDFASSKGHKYTWYVIIGYAIGLVAASAAVILTHLPQPALLYLVPATLGPVVVVSWMRGELGELWEGSFAKPDDKTHAYRLWSLDVLFSRPGEKSHKS